MYMYSSELEKRQARLHAEAVKMQKEMTTREDAIKFLHAVGITDDKGNYVYPYNL